MPTGAAVRAILISDFEHRSVLAYALLSFHLHVPHVYLHDGAQVPLAGLVGTRHDEEPPLKAVR